ncbi:hypothetical protein FAIPA1_80056 [Frankia sp. AiPs1]
MNRKTSAVAAKRPNSRGARPVAAGGLLIGGVDLAAAAVTVTRHGRGHRERGHRERGHRMAAGAVFPLVQPVERGRHREC